ncbi:MAG: lipoyl synthase [Herpetosiphonaceae bacterium]|nr:lipoyl synthase [Herpetosiphonaceae bacterium]
MPQSSGYQRKPEWLRKNIHASDEVRSVKHLLRDLHLNTVCEEAACPNLSECFGRGTATFMIGGDLCTRRCHYCDVNTGRPQALDPLEPRNVAEAARRLQLKYVVVTAVARDDVPDGGALHFAATIRNLRQALPQAEVEVLIPDFKGHQASLQTVLDARPHVLNHNIETVRSIFKRVRPQGDYDRTLVLLERSRQLAPHIPTKSGFMVGLGETDDELRATMRDLRAVGVELLTIGQYLQPSLKHVPVAEYVTPDRYASFRQWGQELGFRATFAGPFVRSSFHAGELLHADDIREQQTVTDVGNWIALEAR